MRGRWGLRLVGVVVVGALGLAAPAAAAAGTITALCTSGGQTQTCGSAWYTSMVSVVWEATPAPTGTSGCQLGIEYQYNDDIVVPDWSCTATWSDNTHASYGFPLNVEVSNPKADAVPGRSPDSNGWYNHPVTVTSLLTARRSPTCRAEDRARRRRPTPDPTP